MTLTKKQMRDITRKAELVINPSGNVGVVMIKGDKLMIEVKRFDFGNFIDSAGMQSMLTFLRQERIVSTKTKTMWMGMYEDRMYLWASL